jgi:hypothetical protein
MSRIVLLHQKAEEAEKRAAPLRRAGHDVEIPAIREGADLRKLRRSPPDAFLIDLDRLPSHGRAAAVMLRQQKETRAVPILFAGGAAEKVAATRKLLPDAAYTDWSHVRSALRRALKGPPPKPVVPGTMQGYSGTPLPKKLGIRAGSRVALLGAPDGFEKKLKPLPEEVSLGRAARGRPGVILLFVKSQADMRRRFPTVARILVEGGRLWMIWPKRSSGIASDLTPQAVRRFGLDSAFVDYKICAVDETWSGLCFARRKKG